MATVSVVILNYNGKGHVEGCVRSVLDLTWPGLDIWVVDNASKDGSADLIEERFGDRVHVLRRTVNSPTAGRNDGFRAACGDYVLSLDNDMVMTDPGVVQKAVAILEQFPDVAVLPFRIGSEDFPDEPLSEHWWHPVSLESGKNQFFFSDWFPEGAVFFRSSALKATGGYEEELFQGYECADLALRLLDRGFDILYCPTLRCVETRVRGWQHVARSRINYLSLRNKLWTAWKNYPLLRGLRYSSTRIGASAVRAARYGWLDLWFEAVRDGIAAPRSIRDKRQVIRPATWNRIRRIRTGQYCKIEIQ